MAARVRIGVCTHLLRAVLIPGGRISEDGALRFVWLSEEEPVPPSLGKACIATLQCFQDRHTIQDGEMADPVLGGPLLPGGRHNPPIMANNGEAFVT